MSDFRKQCRQLAVAKGRLRYYWWRSRVAAFLFFYDRGYRLPAWLFLLR